MNKTIMIQKNTFLVFFLLSSFFCNLGKAQEEDSSQHKNMLILPSQKTEIQTDTTYLALLFKDTSSGSLQEKWSMVFIGKYADGNTISLRSFSPGDITLSDIEEPETYRILSDNRKFYVYKHGGNLSSVDIQGVSHYDDGCNTFFIGTPKNNPVFDQSLYSQIQGFLQYEDEHDQSFSFLALNKNLAKSNVLNRLPYKPTEQHLKIIESSIPPEVNRIAYVGENETKDLIFYANLDNIKFYNCVITTPEKPYLITTVKYGDNWPISSIFIFEQDGEELDLVFTLEDNSWDELGEHFELFDVLDIDGDGINEIIIENIGYENVAIEIYKLIKGHFIRIMIVPLWGC